MLLRADFGGLTDLQSQISRSVSNVEGIMSNWMTQARAMREDWPDQAGFTFDEVDAQHRKWVQTCNTMHQQTGVGCGQYNDAAQNALATSCSRIAST